MSSEYLVEVKDLKQYFPIRTGFMKTTLLKAVDAHVASRRLLGDGSHDLGTAYLKCYDILSFFHNV